MHSLERTTHSALRCGSEVLRRFCLCWPWHPPCSRVSRKSGGISPMFKTPVRMACSNDESLVSTEHGRMYLFRAKLAIKLFLNVVERHISILHPLWHQRPVNKIEIETNSAYTHRPPPISINNTDSLVVHATNSIDQPATLHHHGMFFNSTSWMDGALGVSQWYVPFFYGVLHYGLCHGPRSYLL